MLLAIPQRPADSELVAVAVERTFNWYWLVAGLMQVGYEV
jgi:hypothetical protein